MASALALAKFRSECKDEVTINLKVRVRQGHSQDEGSGTVMGVRIGVKVSVQCRVNFCVRLRVKMRERAGSWSVSESVQGEDQ